MDISIVIPVHNEEKNIPLLIDKLLACAALRELSWEVVFVDDGSTDGTFSALKEKKDAVPEMRIVHFGVNAGKAAAYSAGFEIAEGEIVITMDGDLQDDPAEIPAFLEALEEENVHLVVGWKYQGKGRSGKTLPSKVFNRMLSLLTGLALNDSNCPFRAMRKEVAKGLNIYGDLYRFIPYLAFQKGYQVKQIRVENYPRQFGESKYGVGKIFNGMMDLLTVFFISRYRRRPLHFFGIPGVLSFGVGFAIDLFLVVRGLFFTGRIGHTALLLMGVMLIILGVQLFSLGLLGELLVTQRTVVLKDLPVREILE